MKLFENPTGLWLAASYAGSGPWRDLSGNGHDSSVIEGATFVQRSGTTPAYWSFDGDDYITIPHHADFDYDDDQDYTWVVLFREPDVSDGTQIIVSKKVGLGTQEGWAMYTSGGSVVIHHASNGSASVTDNSALLTDNTIHTGIIRRSGDNVEAGRDGTPSGTPTTDTAGDLTSSSRDIRFGSVDLGAGNFFLTGDLFAAVAYREALSAADLVAVDADLRDLMLEPSPGSRGRQIRNALRAGGNGTWYPNIGSKEFSL